MLRLLLLLLLVLGGVKTVKKGVDVGRLVNLVLGLDNWWRGSAREKIMEIRSIHLRAVDSDYVLCGMMDERKGEEGRNVGFWVSVMFCGPRRLHEAGLG